MDFEMQDVVIEETHERTWDFMIKDGKLRTIDYSKADKQRAIIATYLQYGTIPQLPTTGNQWAELATGQILPQTVNAQVRNSILDMTGQMKYFPKYSEENGMLKVEVVGA